MKALFFVTPNDAADEIWRGVPGKLPVGIVKQWLPTEADQQAAADEGSDRYEICASAAEVLKKLRAGENADACWDEGFDGEWCGFEWREEAEAQDEQE